METKKFCQSCSMPLDKPEMRGTEKDGTPSSDYCTYCYQHGAFLSPGMTLEEMKVLVKTQMEKMNIDSALVKRAVKSLPHLKRWNKVKKPLAV